MFRLSGFAPVGRAETGFLIPFFSSESTNACFAQNLDAEYRIEKFLRFAPDNYEGLRPARSIIDRSVGDPGILAFWFGDEVIYGDCNFIRERLASDPSQIRGAFASVEAWSFLGDDAALSSAITAASGQFLDADRAATWKLGQIAISRMRSLHLGQTGPAETVASEMAERDLIIAGLKSDPDDPEWSHCWLELWSKWPGSTELIDLGHWWLSAGSSQHPGYPVVVSILLRERYLGKAALDPALSWLGKTPPTDHLWPRVWTRAAPYMRGDRWFLERGLRYLAVTAKDHPAVADGSDWIKVWSILSGAQEYPLELARIADEAFSQHLRSARFVEKIMLTPQIMQHHSTVSPAELFDWLDSYPDHNGQWASVYALLLNASPRDERLHVIGNRLIRDFDTRPHVWARIWGALFRREPENFHFYHIAQDWLARAKPNPKARLTVILDILMLKTDLDNQFIGYARQCAREYASDRRSEQVAHMAAIRDLT